MPKEQNRNRPNNKRFDNRQNDNRHYNDKRRDDRQFNDRRKPTGHDYMDRRQARNDFRNSNSRNRQEESSAPQFESRRRRR